ncbi:MAG: histidine kinase N-terminal 7TM domain-containing protein, partial [Armatimonadota bacterium]|nr:histidine kinase N-terminal 7TM domain-containing protein [Armatimonadota bacterium]
MGWLGSVYLVSLAVAVCFSLFLFGLTLSRYGRPGASLLSTLALLTATWTLSSAMEPLAQTMQAKEFWVNAQYFGYSLIPPFYLLLALQHAGFLGRLRTPHLAGLFTIPLFTILFVWTNDLHHLARRDLFLEPAGGLTLLGKTYGPWMGLHVAYAFAATVASIGILLHSAVRSRQPYRAQAVLLAVGIAVPMVWSLLYYFRTSVSPRMDLSPAISTLALGLVVYAVLRLGLGDLAPIAFDRVVAGLRDGVLVIDSAGRLVDLNPAAEVLLNLERPHPIGQRVERALAHLPALAKGIDQARQSDLPEVVLSESEGNRHWEIRVSNLTSRRGDRIGWVVLLHDVTARVRAEEEERRREQQLVQAQRLESLGVLAGRTGCRADLTQERLYSLSPQTREVLRKIDPSRPVYIQAF